MPLRWDIDETKAPENSGAFCHADGDPPMARLVCWPHRSLPRRGFAAFILTTFALFMLPLLTFLGHPALWLILGFMMAALGLLWALLERNYRDAELTETLTLWTDHMTLERRNPRGPAQSWTANPHWVSVTLHATGGPVEQYLTLKGNGREVELGAFLSPEERQSLHGDLQTRLARLR